MDTTVEIAFDLSLAGAGDLLTLDDPVKGLLDSATYVLGGEILTDVTEHVRSLTLRRGRADETTSIDAGTANVVLDNRLRLFDPTAAASVSPYGPSILPRKEIVVKLANDPIFTGQVEDWDLQYTLDGDATTVAKSGDGFTLLSERNLASGAGATGISSSVIYQSASAAGWPMGRVSLDEGTASVGAHTIQTNQKALPYLQKISNAEQALIFIGKDGTLSFRDRISPRRNTRPLFADDDTGIPFRNIQIVYGTEFLYTQVIVNYPSGSASAQSASSSIVDYGVRELTLDTFLPNGTEAGVIGAFLAGRYGQPTFKIVGIEVQLNGLSVAQRAQVLGLELGDGVEVVFTPNGIGDALFRELAVDGIEHEVTPVSHVVRFKLFEPFLVRRSGSVVGSSSTAGKVTGFKGTFGTIAGSSGTAGTVTGFKGTFGFTVGSQGTEGFVLGGEGNVGRIVGSSTSSGTVVGTKTEAGFFTLDSSALDSGAVLQ